MYVRIKVLFASLYHEHTSQCSVAASAASQLKAVQTLTVRLCSIRFNIIPHSVTWFLRSSVPLA